MRMWMVPPSEMCRQHLLGEPLEIHMAVGAIRAGRSIKGHLDKGQLQPSSFWRRHDALAKEMLNRGYQHKSPLPKILALTTDEAHALVNVNKSRRELVKRCAACQERMGL